MVGLGNQGEALCVSIRGNKESGGQGEEALEEEEQAADLGFELAALAWKVG